jgi:acetate kinase
MVRKYLGYAAMTVFLLTMDWGAAARAQSRLNDKDMARLMQNLSDDAQPFRQSFANALKKSTIRGTSRDKDARRLADTFARQAKQALETFKHKRKAESEVTAMVSTAGQIDALVYSLHVNPTVTAQWEKLRTELHQVAQGFGVPEAYFQSQPGQSQSGAAMASAGEQTSCVVSVGTKRSAELVRECLQVSPATHPPCNAQNACALIVDEIRRGCGMLGRDAPGFCAEYR